MICAIIFLFAFSVSGVANISVNEIVSQAQIGNLANDPTWYSLLHYKQRSKGIKKEIQSEVISQSFFLAENGRTNPKEELIANVVAMAAPFVKGEEKQHARCRFPARYLWLKSKLYWLEDTQKSQSTQLLCKDFLAWSYYGKINSVSLIFVAGYLSNPASFYGHILLKFHISGDNRGLHLLDTTINFGADVPANDNQVMYIIKGLFGGYQAVFSEEKFYRFNHNYAEDELRDLWEYPLKLTESQLQLLVAHSWEMLGQDFRYFFFKKNCAYHMDALLKVATGESLLPSKRPWSLPASLFDELFNRKDIDFIQREKVNRIKSRQSRFHDKFLSLSTESQRIARTFILENDLEDHQRISDSVAIRNRKILSTLIDYYSFLEARYDQTEKQQEKLDYIRKRLLQARLSLEVGGEKWEVEKVVMDPPHKSQKPLLTQISVGHNDFHNTVYEFRIRPVYYDLLSLDAGRPKYTKLEMFDLRVGLNSHKLTLKQLDIADVFALNQSITDIPGDGGHAWKFRLGWEQNHLGCDSCLSFNLSTGVGRAIQVAKPVVGYAMLEGRLQSKSFNQGQIAIGPELGVIFNGKDLFSNHLNLGLRNYIEGDKETLTTYSWEVKFGRSRNLDFRLLFKKLVAKEFNFAVSFYW